MWAGASSASHLLCGPIGGEDAGRAEDLWSFGQVLLPQPRSNRDMKRDVLTGQVIYFCVIRCVIVDRPAVGSQHQISRFPLVSLPLHDTPSAAFEEIVDGGRGMPVRAVDNVRRAQTNRCKECV